MLESFAADFLLPLVQGGSLRVSRPLGPRAVARMAEQAAALAGRVADMDPSEPLPALARARRIVVARFLPAGAAPRLDEISLRLGAALHDLLAMAHPDLGGPGAGRRQERIAEAALGLASIAAPRSAREAVERHSLLARLGEIARVDRTVHFWLGQQTFVGRTPPGRVLALPSLRRVRVAAARRGWLREIGIPTAGRRAFLALNVASPLGEALDPLRLDPPVGWGRILPALRFPALARAIGGTAIETGVDRVGDALSGALYRFAGLHDPPFGLTASAESVAFAISFLAHLVWLDVLFGGAREEPRAGDAGLDLAVILTAAARTRPGLVWPADVSPESDLGVRFRGRLEQLGARAVGAGAPRLSAALSLVEFALTPGTRPVAL